ncbi:hypothetical protein B0O80DRAFT_225437 [Mortierella sp. GBAus27b]|nr:hypothetical protein B0O80DRAFT_225437 [Mortierella sp. GBAus27b]
MGPIHSSTKHLTFLEINDGSGLKGIQAILSGGEGKGLVPRTSFESDRTLVTSLGKEQTLKLQAFDMKLVGICDGVIYPFKNTLLGIDTRLRLGTSFPGRRMHQLRCYSGFWMLEVEMVFLNKLDHHLDLQKDDSKRSHATC